MRGIPTQAVQLHLGLCRICGNIGFYMRRHIIGWGFLHLKHVKNFTIEKIKT